MNELLDPLLTPQYVAAQLGIPLGTLYQWNSKGTGPRRVKIGRHIRYRRVDVERFVEQHADPLSAVREAV